MRITRFFISVWLFVLPAFAQNVVLLNGTVVDGTGKARFVGNVRIRDGKIVDVGLFKPAAGETGLDVKGLVVAPGFIDLERVSATAIANSLDARAEILQGVTTVILGSDGTGPYSIEEFMLPFDEKPPAVNIAMLVGHGTVRRQIMGSEYKRAATADEISRMAELVGDAMRQGAFGLASDLGSDPASFSTTDELLALAKALNRYGGTLFVHPRDENVQEALDLSRTAKVAIQLSISKFTPAVLTATDKARMQGIDVGIHVYGLAESGVELRALLQNPAVAISWVQYLQEQKALGLERAIQKLTGLPAARIGLRERGVIRKGVPADIVVFNPQALSSGMKYVFVNGVQVLTAGEVVEARPGQALR